LEFFLSFGLWALNLPADSPPKKQSKTTDDMDGHGCEEKESVKSVKSVVKNPHRKHGGSQSGTTDDTVGHG
jgi:hypothetical protein